MGFENPKPIMRWGGSSGELILWVIYLGFWVLGLGFLYLRIILDSRVVIWVVYLVSSIPSTGESFG